MLQVKSKLNFLTFVTIPFLIPWSLRQRYDKLNNFYCKIQERLLEHLSFNELIVCFNNIYYSLIDYESLDIISPRFEHCIYKYFKPESGDVFIDIGAHIGKYTLKAARDIGNNGLVIAIEPVPINFIHLLKGIKLNDLKNIIALNTAAWNKNSFLRINFGKTSGQNSSKLDVGLGYMIVKARTIDSLVNQFNLNRIDWAKIDVEGAEFEVIEGALKTFSNFKTKIIVEVFHENFKKVSNLLINNGYNMILIPMPYKCENNYYFAFKSN